MAAAAPAAPYDDGSSTESEYYFDPREEAEEEAAYAWTHEHDAQSMKQPTTEDSTVIKQEYSDYGQLQQDTDEIALPCGSEWSHGGASTVYDNAVQQALAMAQQLTNTQREEPLTDDTMNSTSSPIETKEVRKTVILKKSEEVKVKPKVVSFKSVKAPTPPASSTKSVAVGLRSSPKNVVGGPSEMHKELSVARPQRKATGSQSSSQKSPSHKEIKVKVNDDNKVPSMKQAARKSPSVRKSEPDKVSSSCRTEHSKSSSRRSRSPSVRRRRSPSPRRADRKRSTSPVRYSSRRSRSRSPLSRRVCEIRKRSRSRSPYRPSTSSPRSRSYRSVERVSSPRYHESKRRCNRTYKRSRSPSQPSRTYHSTNIRYRSRSRSRSRDRDDRRHDFRRDHYDNGRSSSQQTRQLNSRHSSRSEYASASRGSRQNQETTHHQSSSYGKKKQIITQRSDYETGKRSDQRSSGANRSASKPRLQDSEPLRSCRPIPDKVVVSTSKPDIVEPSKRSLRDPRIRPRVESSVVLHDDGNSKKRGYVYHDAFERRVFKLKLQEADVDEKMAAGSLTGKEEWFYNQRRQNMAAERAKLEAENLERFEKLYKSTQVTRSDLRRYQSDRDFAARVVRFKREQASLQEQKNLFLSSETQNALWRRLDKERDELMAENSIMFHKVMMDTQVPSASFNGKTAGGPANFTDPQHSGKRAHGTGYNHVQPQLKRRPSTTIPMNRQRNSAASSANSRVVVGASLQLQSDHDPDNFKTPPAIAGNTPWFLKG